MSKEIKAIEGIYGYPLVDRGVRNNIKNNYQKKADDALTTTNKTISGAINEINTQCKDIKENLNNLDLKKYEEKIVPSIALANYSLATNLENNIGRLGKHINGTVSLVNADMNGNISQNDILVAFEQNAAPSLPKWIKAFCITSTGAFEEFYCTIEWSNNGTIIKSQQNVKNNNIRYIICEFVYISNL